MDIAALVNPVSEAPPRRSPSGSGSHILAPSPATSNAKLPTPPMTTNNKPMSRKRKRHDTKPIWAVRESEIFDGQTLQQHLASHRKEEPRPPPTPQTQARPPPDAIHNGPPPTMTPGPPQPLTSHELSGYERPISDDANVYDEMSRKVCDFIWQTVIENVPVQDAIQQSPGTMIEIEARWGQIQDRHTGHRVNAIHASECVVRESLSEDTKFESTMTMEQHKRMNNYLNGQVQKSQAPGAMRARVDYKHTKEVDQFFELTQDGFNQLPQATKILVAQAKTRRQRIRVTRDMKNGNMLAAIIKHRIANLEISSPNTEWDYRIGVNLEIKYPGPFDVLQEVIEPGKSVQAMKRYKDRVSYAWLGAYQVDLTQVSQENRKNHELELELNAGVLLENANNVQQGRPNQYESLINGMMNNLRVLSREITPASA